MATQTATNVVSIAEIGRRFYAQNSDKLAFTRGQWHSYEHGVWTPMRDLTIRRRVWQLLETVEAKDEGKATLMKVNSVLDYLKARYFVHEELVDSRLDLVNLANGVYSLKRGDLLPHSPDYYFTTQFPFDYDPRAEATTWQMYLMSTFVKPRSNEYDEELAEFVQEAMGYSLTTDISHHVTFWCIGEGANGKGVLFHVLEQLGGTAATPFNVGLLKREQYQLANLAGKRIALCSESGATQNLVEDALVKALVGGDSMNVRQIRREPFVLRPTVKLWWAMNELPAVADTSEGFWRRVRVIPFNRNFEQGERILDLKDRLDAELPGIFVWAMKGLKRLNDRGRFIEPTQVVSSTSEYRVDSNPVKLFVEAECRADPGKEVQSSVIYAEYKDWCLENTFKPVSSRRFKREMERLGFFHKATSAYNVYTGLELKVNPWP